MDKEVRSIVTEVRAIEDDTGKWVEGYGLVFNEWSQDLGGFRERILPSAIGDSLASDLVVCVNHDANNVLGRISAGTVRAEVDERGVKYRALVNDSDPFAVAYYERIKRGDISGSSFAFWVDKDTWYVEDGFTCRDIVAFKSIDEMGPVTFPAYLQTSSEARSAAAEARDTDFGATLEYDDARRSASWLRFYQLESALETSIVDGLFEGADDATVEKAIADFASAAKEWFTAHRTMYAGWYPPVDEARAALAADAERRAALLPHEQREDAVEDTGTADAARVESPAPYPGGLHTGLPLFPEKE